jgi:hypothetical protein
MQPARGQGEVDGHARDPRELAWLTQSSGALGALATFLVNDKPAGVDRTIELLLRAGWHEILDRIVGRLDPAVRVSFSPYEGDLGTKGRWLLAVMRELNEPTKNLNG